MAVLAFSSMNNSSIKGGLRWVNKIIKRQSGVAVLSDDDDVKFYIIWLCKVLEEAVAANESDQMEKEQWLWLSAKFATYADNGQYGLMMRWVNQIEIERQTEEDVPGSIEFKFTVHDLLNGSPPCYIAIKRRVWTLWPTVPGWSVLQSINCRIIVVLGWLTEISL